MAVLRIAHDLLPRLKSLADNQFQILLDGTRQEQQQILWMAVCKRYQIIVEFADQVIREKYLRQGLTQSRIMGGRTSSTLQEPCSTTLSISRPASPHPPGLRT
jgi:hypothetical protein